MKKLFLTTLVSFNCFAAPMSPSSLKLKVYKMAVSTRNDCASPTTVVDNGNSPVYVDFVNNPDLGSGSVADGTYPCIIIEFSDNIKVTPNASGSYCSTGVEVTQDVCRDYNSDSDNNPATNPTTSTLIDGTTTTCNSSANRVAMYITRASSATTSSDAFNPPGCNTVGCTSAYGFQLGSSLTVSGSAVAKFVVNADNKVCDGNDGGAGACSGEDPSSCNMLPPSFSFSQVP